MMPAPRGLEAIYNHTPRGGDPIEIRIEVIAIDDDGHAYVTGGHGRPGLCSAREDHSGYKFSRLEFNPSTIVPAAPGWYVEYYQHGDPEPYKEEIIAWRIDTTSEVIFTDDEVMAAITVVPNCTPDSDARMRTRRMSEHDFAVRQRPAKTGVDP
jgi:hypothetical protein